MNIKNVTLCYLCSQDKVLLAMKKRDFGKGKWNGVGGKLLLGESFVQASIREIYEEIGVEVAPEDFQLVAVMDFCYPKTRDKEAVVHYCPVYFVTKWKGEPQETDEMKPRWFPISKLPFDQMWSDDVLWLTRVLAGERLRAKFWFDEKYNITKHEISPLEEKTV